MSRGERLPISLNEHRIEDAAHNGGILTTGRVAPMQGHYFTPKPDAPTRPRRLHIDLGDVSFDVHTDREVFSPQRLDPGTRVLLDAIPPPSPGDQVLDGGAGYGPIALALALRQPEAQITAVEINERAQALCRSNAAALNISTVRVVGPDQLGDSQTFDALYSNPPIRIGKPALHALLETWLRLLRPSGSAYLVVNKNLGADSLARWLDERGYPSERMVSRQGFRVLRVWRADGAPDQV
jgi:16S rRNA (guanine1207-N2)-methyltransferase